MDLIVVVFSATANQIHSSRGSKRNNRAIEPDIACDAMSKEKLSIARYDNVMNI
jgi:hypothetical protein